MQLFRLVAFAHLIYIGVAAAPLSHVGIILFLWMEVSYFFVGGEESHSIYLIYCRQHGS
jgi:hypothetical protein